MASEIVLAYVNFFKESRGRKVVQTKDISDLNPPRFHDDFDEDRTYKVKWHLLATEASSTEEATFDAKILCLGVDIDDLRSEAKRRGFNRLPQSTDVVKGSSEKPKGKGKGKESPHKKSARGRPLKKIPENTSVAPPPPKCKKKKKLSSEDKTRDSRCKKLIDQYQNLFGTTEMETEDDSISVDEVHPIVKPTTCDSSAAVLPKVKESHSPSPMKLLKSPLKLLKKSPLKLIKKSPIKSSLNSPNKSSLIMKSPLKSGSGDGGADSMREPDLPKPDLPVKSKESFVYSPLKFSLDDSFAATEPIDDTDEDQDILSDREEQNVHQPPIKKSPVDLDRALRKKDEKKILQGSSSESSGTYVPSDAEKDLYYRKIRSQESELSKYRTRVLELETQVGDLQRNNDALRMENKRVKKVNLSLSQMMNEAATEDLSPNKAVLVKAAEPVKNEALKSEPVESVRNNTSAPVKIPHTSKKRLFNEASPASPEAKKKKSKKLKTDDEGKYTSNKDLAQMLVPAFGDASSLASDGAGKVHIGNNVYLNKSIFKDKISKATVAPTIALRDAMGAIYKEEELAARSLDGGTPVRGDKSIKKAKMTPRKRESLLGVYRAKVIQTTGNTDEEFLELHVNQKGKSTMREKLKEAHRKVVNKSPKNEDSAND